MALPVLKRDSDTRHVVDERAIASRDPFGDLEHLHREIARFLGGWQPSRLLDAVFTPLADVEETIDAYVIDVELPGVRRDDLQIEVAGRRLSVHGERKERERVGILRRRERTIGRFSYEVTLPGDVDDERIGASLDDGVLKIHVPKPETERPRRITVR